MKKDELTTLKAVLLGCCSNKKLEGAMCIGTGKPMNRWTILRP